MTRFRESQRESFTRVYRLALAGQANTPVAQPAQDFACAAQALELGENH